MKFGISSYSLYSAMKQKRMDILEVIEWIAGQGAEHVEIVPGLGFDIHESGMVERICDKASSLGLPISNYAVGANFIAGDQGDFEREIEKTLRHVDIAYRLGVKKMRHDVASRPAAETGIARFEADLERIVPACREIADYAAQFGITTSVENHGYHVQSGDRVLRLLHAVDRDNFKTTLDIGNFMFADENPVAAVKKTLPFASMVHLKDFYLRPSTRNPGKGFNQSISGNYLRGAILGHGDIDLWEIIRLIKDSGYEGELSIEFEGMEDCLIGTSIGLENVRRILSQVKV